MPRGVFIRTKPAPKVDRVLYMEEAVTRFWSKVRRGKPEDCWEWTGAFLKGSRASMRYGSIGLVNSAGRSVTYRAHRFAWMLVNGSIQDGMNVLHRCDNTKCCNPSHLFLGTQRENIDDQLAKGRWLRGEQAGRAKLTEAQVLEMRASDKPDKYYAELYSVYPQTIRKARNGEKWAHLPGAQIGYPGSEEKAL